MQPNKIKELKDGSVSEYNPIWTRNSNKTVQVNEKKENTEKQPKKKLKVEYLYNI